MLRPWALVLLVALPTFTCGGRGGGPERAIVVAVPYSDRGLDPHRDATLSSHLADLYNVYESLVEMDTDLRIRPALARSWSTPDERTWVFELREARFHSGRPLSSADVVYSLERARDPKRDTSYYLGGVESVAARGPGTVVIRTSGPSPVLLNRLSFVLVVPSGAGEALDRHADGTGPYAVTEWRPGERLGLRRHDGWWGSPPPVVRIEVRMGQDERAAAAGLLRGEFQLAQFRTAAELGPIAASPEWVVRERESFYVTYLGWNLSPRGGGPFADGRVRRAVDLALDRDAMAATLSRRVRPAGQLVSRQVFGFDPTLTPARPDQVRARDLLREAGHAPGFEATLSVRPRHAQVAEIVRAHLARVGIRLHVDVLPDESYFEQLAARRLTTWIDNWGCTTGDAGELFENAFHSPAGPGLGAFNEAGYSDPRLDRQIEEAARLEGDARRDALQHLMRAVMAEAAWLPLYTDVDIYAVRRSLDWEPRPDTSLRFAEMSVRRGP